MNTAHMTAQDWNQYLTEQNNPAIEFIENLISATKKEFIPAIDAEIIRQRINFKMKELYDVCQKMERIQQARSIENWKK